MKNKKISIRIIFPVVMSASIAACIISCILLFSYYFSTYFQKDAIEKIGKQRDFLAQSLETQIENINVLINRIYYQNIKKYDVDSARFAEEMEQQIFLEEKCLYGLALYDIDGESIWHSGTFAEQEDAKEMAWFLQANEKNCDIFINTTGRFVVGGPMGDSGLTGRKLIQDSYGGMGSHGGGAFSGKDPSKVDRSAAYMARYVAKNVVAAGLAPHCEVQVAYCIGVADPVSVLVSSQGSGEVPDEILTKAVREVFDLRPYHIIKRLDLKRPIFQKTACYGHFGRELPEFTWEKTDAVQDLLTAAKV